MLVTLNPFGPEPRPRYWNQPDEATFLDVDEAIPDNAEARRLSSTAHALYISGVTETALKYAQDALALARIVPTLVNAAVILEQMGRFKEALPLAEEAWKLDPDNRNATILYSQALLRMGRFREGWPLYIRECALWPEFSSVIKEWNGEDLTGKRIIVVEGGAYGDNLYFLRWLKDLPAEITYVCQPSFAPLVRHLGFNAAENWSGNVDIKFIHYDYLTSVLALPGRLGVTLENYKWDGPYIKFENKIISPTIPPNRPMRVGICSLAGERSSPLRIRSMHDSQLHQVLHSLPNRHLWVNLTYKHGMPEGVDHPSIDNWLQTAEAISKCDLVVTIDTGVAHLAGAMGVPTWIVLPGASAWQWLLTETNPLYPTMKLFRNQGEGLDNAVEKLCDHLSRL